MSVSAGLHSKATIDDALDALTFGLTNNILNDNSNDSIGSKPFSSSSSASSTSSSSSCIGNGTSSAKNVGFSGRGSDLNGVGAHLGNGFGLETAASGKGTISNKSELVCLLCKKRLVEPKLLDCLHSFCKQCLIAHSIPESGDSAISSVSCPVCKQETLVSESLGIDGLEDDYVMLNMLDMLAIEEKSLECTSCKTDEKAVARCADCAHFLCPSCVSAHQYMRCFETHHVVGFDDIRKSFHKLSKLSSSGSRNFNDGQPESGVSGLPIHKPLFCRLHPKEGLKYFCHSCQMPACTECVVSVHQQPMHACDRICDIENKAYEELETAIAKLKEKIDVCHNESQALDQFLGSLQEQADASKGLIEETYNSYKAILEKKRDELLKELDEKHANKELAIMDLHSNLEVAVNNLNDIVRFTERILKNGNSQEILLLKRLAINQTKFLFANLPQLDNIDINLRFMTDEKRFERAVHDFFGRFYPFKEGKPPLPSSNGSNSNGKQPQPHQHHHHQQQQQQQSLLGSGMANVDIQQQQQRVQAIQQLQKQFEQHQMQLGHHQQQQHLTHSAHPPVEQDWLLMNMCKPSPSPLLNPYSAANGSSAGDRRGSIHSPMSPAAPALNDEWLVNMAKMSNGGALPSSFDDLSQQHQQQWLMNNMALFNSASSTNKLSQQQQQLMLNTLNSLQPPTHVHGFPQQRANSPMIDNFLSANHTSSRCHTPSGLIQPGHGLNGGHKNVVANAVNGDSTQMSALNAANAHSAGNNLDDFLSLGSGSGIAQNFSQLTKLIAPTVDLSTLNNLNELVLTAGLNGGSGSLNGFSDVNSNSSQSPPVSGVIGSGLNSLAAGTAPNTQAGFVGNGNLNPPIRQNGKMSNMQIRTKFGTLGSGKSQFNSPHGFCLGADEEIIVADTNNHRIQVFTKEGDLRFSFGSPGRDEGQLWYPRKVAVMRETGKFVVCDRGNERSRMQIFSKSGHFLKKIAIRYIDIVAGLAITQNGDIVAVDSVSPTVFRVSEEGEILKWFECSDHMREPSDIAISGNEYYVCDFKGHCVVVFNEEGTYMRRIGGENITNFPNGIDVSDAGDVLVGDSHGNRFHVAVFSRDGSMLSEFECPYVKVSRCCGLKITSEGYVVTLAKNNHHVLVLNTLYVS